MGLSAWDAYAKVRDDMKIQTVSGAAVSMATVFVTLLLFIGELGMYLAGRTVYHVEVDTRGVAEPLLIHFDVSFPHIPCEILSLDHMDAGGTRQLDVANHHVFKQDIDEQLRPLSEAVKHELEVLNAKPPTVLTPEQVLAVERTKTAGYCGTCYGAEKEEGQCCNTCDELKKAYRTKGWALPDLHELEQCMTVPTTAASMKTALARGVGCRMNGYLEVNKVAGNFHFAPGQSYQHGNIHIHDLDTLSAGDFNVSHTIHKIHFGPEVPSAVQPLTELKRIDTRAGKEKMASKNMHSLPGGLLLALGGSDPSKIGGMFSYYLKVVPTDYSRGRHSVSSNQYSATDNYKLIDESSGGGLPGAFFFYEISPILVKIEEGSQSFGKFLVHLCAIIGGVVTLAGVVDRCFYNGLRRMKQNAGKFS